MKDCLTFVIIVVTLATNTGSKEFKNQTKEDLLYRPWIKATNMVELLKQNRGRERWNAKTNEQRAESSSNPTDPVATNLQIQAITYKLDPVDGLNQNRESKGAEEHSMQDWGFLRLSNINS